MLSEKAKLTLKARQSLFNRLAVLTLQSIALMNIFVCTGDKQTGLFVCERGEDGLMLETRSCGKSTYIHMLI